MTEVQKGYHCAYQIHYHIVFPVKYRKALLTDEIKKSLQDIAKGIEERYGMEIERLGSDEDHVHLLCGAHPKYAPGQLVRLFKSSRLIAQTYKEEKERLKRCEQLREVMEEKHRIIVEELAVRKYEERYLIPIPPPPPWRDFV